MKKPNTYQLARQLGKHLLKKGWTVAVAESCTGGGLAYSITSVAGSAQWFDRGVVTYTNEAKIDLLGVSDEILTRYGAVSTETASEMAAGVLERSDADVSLSITGVAGPAGGSIEKPVGTVCFGLAVRDGQTEAVKEYFLSGRKHVRDCAAGFALNWLLKVVQ